MLKVDRRQFIVGAAAVAAFGKVSAAPAGQAGSYIFGLFGLGKVSLEVDGWPVYQEWFHKPELVTFKTPQHEILNMDPFVTRPRGVSMIMIRGDVEENRGYTPDQIWKIWHERKDSNGNFDKYQSRMWGCFI